MNLGPFQRTGAVSVSNKACRAAGASWPCLHCVWWVNVCVYVSIERERQGESFGIFSVCVCCLFVRECCACSVRHVCVRACRSSVVAMPAAGCSCSSWPVSLSVAVDACVAVFLCFCPFLFICLCLLSLRLPLQQAPAHTLVRNMHSYECICTCISACTIV